MPARDVPYLEGGVIRFSPGFAQTAKLSFARVETSGLSPVVSVTGTVSFDLERVAAVGARIPGRVRRVVKVEGDPIAAGELLAEIESADLGQAQAALIAARAHAEAASINEKREKELAEARVSSNREAELAVAAAATARAELIAAEQRVRALGGSGTGEAGILSLTSPIAGKVIERHVARGQSVEPSFTAFRVADLSRVWIELSVFERELSAVRVGDAVDLAAQTGAPSPIQGTVSRVGDVIDLQTRAAPVRVVVANADGRLRIGQSVVAQIHTQATESPKLVISRDAFTLVDGKPTVFVARDATSVEPRMVQLGAQDASRVEVTSGLSPGDRIAVTGVFALKSEIFR
jgi:cobalt-zinc-cadmium efflux system membrane fusion protein